MKTYSRLQLIFFSLAAAVLMFLFAMGFGLIDVKKSAQAAAAENPDGFLLQTNSLIPRDLTAVNDSRIYTPDENENITIYDALNRAVVNINIEIVALNWFLEPVPREGGSGSGSIIDKRGYVLTNRHVVEKAYKVFVTLHDGSQFEGEVIGSDPETDLAVIKFDPKGHELITIPFGSSANLKVGQKVLAIGNPFGYERTLTTGVVSGLGRPIRPSSGSQFILRSMIQTDASINPGNSGGPLINSRGEMIGINTMIYSPTGGSIGIGFAVPVDIARRIVPELIKNGHVKRGWIEMEAIQLFPELVKYAKLPVSKGLLISDVKKGTNAWDAGLRGGSEAVRYGRNVFNLGGDIIVEVDGIPVASLADYYAALEDNKPGESVPVVIIKDGARKTLNIKLAERQAK